MPQLVKNLPTNSGNIRDTDSLGLGRSPGVRCGNPLQHSFLENPMDRGAILWLWATVHGLQRVRHNLATGHACMHKIDNHVHRRWSENTSSLENSGFHYRSLMLGVIKEISSPAIAIF